MAQEKPRHEPVDLDQLVVRAEKVGLINLCYSQIVKWVDQSEQPIVTHKGAGQVKSSQIISLEGWPNIWYEYELDRLAGRFVIQNPNPSPYDLSSRVEIECRLETAAFFLYRQIQGQEKTRVMSFDISMFSKPAIGVLTSILFEPTKDRERVLLLLTNPLEALNF